MMKVILLAHKFEGGGVQKVVREIAAELASRDIKPIVVLSHEQVLSKEPYEIECIPFHTNKGRKALKSFLTLSVDEKDLILCNTYDSYKALRKIAAFEDRCFNYLHVNYYAMYFKNKFSWSNIERYLNFLSLFRNRKVIGVSEGVLNGLIKNLKITPSFKSVIPAPVNFKKIEALSQEVVNDLPEGDYLVIAARLAKRKKVDMALRALQISKLNIPLLIVGEGAEKEALLALAKELELHDRVQFLGWKQNPYPYVMNAKAYLSCSDVEGSPLGIVEAMYLGTPVISTDADSGPSEILGEKYHDLITPKRDIDAFADKLMEFQTLQNQSRFSKEELRSHVSEFGVIPVVNKLILLASNKKING